MPTATNSRKVLSLLYPVFTAFLCILITLAVYFSSVLPLVENGLRPICQAPEEFSAAPSLPFPNQGTLVQEFWMDQPFCGLSIRLQPITETLDSGTLEAVLLDADTDTVLAESSYDLTEENKSGIVNLRFSQKANTTSGHYVVKITAANIPETARVVPQLSDTNDFESGPAILSGHVLEASTWMTPLDDYENIPAFFWLIAVLISVLAVAAVCMRNLRKAEYFYLLLALGFVVPVMMLQSPTYGFDLEFHKDITYTLSNRMLGQEGFLDYRDDEIDFGDSATDANSDAAPAEDALQEGAEPQPQGLYGTRPQYYWRRACDDFNDYPYIGEVVQIRYYSMLAEKAAAPVSEQDTMLVKQTARQPGASSYLYLPQAFGMTLGRLFNWNGFFTISFARLCNYLVFVLLAFFAIRITPVGKNVFMIAALLPAVFSQTLSLSRDGMILALAFYLTAKMLQIGSMRRHPRWFDVVLLLSAALLLAPAKFIYIPICLLCLPVLYRHLSPTAQKIMLAAGGICILAGVIVFALNFDAFTVLWNSSGYSVDNLPDGRSFAYVFAHPGELLMMLYNTLRLHLGDFLINAISLYDIRIGNTALISGGFTCLMLLAALPTKSDSSLFPQKMKGWIIAALLLLFGMLATVSMRWTPLSSMTIVGLQGRYFTPILPLFFLLFSNNKLLSLQKMPHTFLRMSTLVLLCNTWVNLFQDNLLF